MNANVGIEIKVSHEADEGNIWYFVLCSNLISVSFDGGLRGSCYRYSVRMFLGAETGKQSDAVSSLRPAYNNTDT